MHVKKQHSLALSAVLQMVLCKHYPYGSWITQSIEGQGFHGQQQMFCVTRKVLRTWHGQGFMKGSKKCMLVPAKKKKKVFCFKPAHVLYGQMLFPQSKLLRISTNFNSRQLNPPTARNITNLKTLERLLSKQARSHFQPLFQHVITQASCPGSGEAREGCSYRTKVMFHLGIAVSF